MDIMYWLNSCVVDALSYSIFNGNEIFSNAASRHLVSGSDHYIVKKIADHLGGYDFAQGSEPGCNLVGAKKATFLQKKYPDGFDYIGNSTADIEVWACARQSYGINVSQRTIRKAKEQGINLKILTEKKFDIKQALNGLRLHQWSKNGLIAVLPFLNLGNSQGMWLLWLAFAFLSFGLITSATYLVNDLFDIQADRSHKTKKNRPFASGNLPIHTGIILIASLLFSGLCLAYLLNINFAMILMSYIVLSLLYSTYLKKIPILDTLLLSILFCSRIVSGGVLLDITPNAWLMIALGFFFLALALGKRAIELFEKRDSNLLIKGRGYIAQDFTVVLVTGIASSFISVVTVAIYLLLSESTVIRNDTSAILITAILIFWLMRFWLFIGRNTIQDDPVVFALKDRLSIFILGILGIIVAAEQLLDIGLRFNS